MLLARWMLPVPHDVANLTNLFSPALDCAGIPGINGRQQTHTNTTHEKSRKPNNSTTEQVSIPMVSLSTSCMMKWKLRRWESILYEISLPRAVLNSVALLILLPRGRNGCACTQGCNMLQPTRSLRWRHDLLRLALSLCGSEEIGGTQCIRDYPSVASVLAGRLFASHGLSWAS